MNMGLEGMQRRLVHNLGQSPEAQQWLHARAIDWEVALRAGVGYMDSSRRLSFPCRDADGSLRGHKFRSLHGKKFSYIPPRAGLASLPPWRARWVPNPDRVFLCEGESDALCLASTRIARYDLGTQVVAIPGVENVRREWFQEWEGMDIYVIADGAPGEAGDTMRYKVAQIAPKALMVPMPAETDLTDLVLREGVSALAGRIESARPLPAMMIPDARLPREDNGSLAHLYPLLPAAADTLGLRLEHYGAELRALCPFHEERTPSFNVNPDKGVWRCWGCGKQGGVVEFVKRMRPGWSGVDAVEFLEGLQ